MKHVEERSGELDLARLDGDPNLAIDAGKLLALLPAFDVLHRRLAMDDGVWDASTFSKNRDRLLAADVAREFLATLVSLPQVKRLLSSDHFSVDGTLIEAWASMKSFRPKNGSGSRPRGGHSGERDFHHEKRSNETHASTTDPDARLFRKGDGRESRLCFIGHTLMENRNGLAVQAEVSHATGTAERDTALRLVERHVPPARRVTLAADKLFDVERFVTALRRRKVTPHVTIDGRISKTGVKRKTAGGIAKVKVRGIAKVNAVFTFAIAAYNLIRIPKLIPFPP